MLRVDGSKRSRRLAVPAGLILGVLSVAAGAAGCAPRRAASSVQDPAWAGYSNGGQAAFAQGRYDDAEQLFAAGLQEAEHFRARDARRATSLNNLAAVYRVRHRYADAASLDRRALAIRTTQPPVPAVK